MTGAGGAAWPTAYPPHPSLVYPYAPQNQGGTQIGKKGEQTRETGVGTAYGGYAFGMEKWTQTHTPKPRPNLPRGTAGPAQSLRYKWTRISKVPRSAENLGNLYGKRVPEHWVYRQDSDDYLVTYYRVKRQPRVEQCLEENLTEGQKIMTWLPQSVEIPSHVLKGNPIVIQPPFTFRMKDIGKVDWEDRELGDRAARFGYVKGGNRIWGMWAWESYWVDQVVFWRGEQLQNPEMVFISREQGIVVDRHWYCYAGSWCEPAWVWKEGPHTEEWIGGYQVCQEVMYGGWPAPEELPPRSPADKPDRAW